MTRFSYSKLSAFDQCPLKFRYQYVQQVPSKTSPALFLGQIVHDTIAAYEKALQRKSSGQIVAGAIRNARLVSALTARNRELAGLVDFGGLPAGPGGVTPLLRTLTERVSQVVGAAACRVFAAEGDRFRCLFSWQDGEEDRSGAGHVLDPRHQAAGETLATGGGIDPEPLDLAQAGFDGFQRDAAKDGVTGAGDEEIEVAVVGRGHDGTLRVGSANTGWPAGAFTSVRWCGAGAA